jgi:DNA invertase Pin-like site-specific DNA recombinase
VSPTKSLKKADPAREDAVRAGVYVRISQDVLETGLGVERQSKDCRALAKRKGWTVVEEFRDNDVSASRGKVRPAYTDLMTKLQAGHLDALVVWDVDRLTRTPRELEDVVDLAEKRGLQLASVGGEIDLATPQGRLTARIKGSAARHEVEQLSRRVKAKHAELAERGASVGPIAYGWQRERSFDQSGRQTGYRDVLHPEQAAVLREAAAAVLAGDSLASICRRLNDRGVPAPKSKAWSLTILRSLLLRERNACRRVHQGRVVGMGDWDRLFDDETQERLRAILRDPSRRTSRDNSIKYLLTGIAKCGVCGTPLRVLPDKNRATLRYICNGGWHVSRSLPALDAFVSDILIARLSQPDALALFDDSSNDDVEKLRVQVAALRAKLNLAADQYSDDVIDAEQFARVSAKIRPQLATLEAQLRSSSTAPDLLDLAIPDIADKWDDVPLMRRRKVISALVDVTVNRVTRHGTGTGFDHEAVRVNWKAETT